MPNPVAEVVERLRRRAEACRLTHNFLMQKEFAEYADLLERLSREKEAGEFWSGVFNEITDKTEREKIADELTDFHFMMDEVPKVYMHITGGRMSKTNYYAADVIAEADSYSQDCYREDTDAELAPLKAEIERLSRERDTGVPEGWQLVPKEPTAEMLASGVTAGVGAAPEPWCPHAYRAMLSAAPQPPTVSTQGWQDISTAPRDGTTVDLWIEHTSQCDDAAVVRNCQRYANSRWWPSKGWCDSGGNKREFRDDGADYWMESKVTHWMPLPAKPGEHQAPQPDIVAALTRERDQAREALAELLETSVLLAGRHEVGMGVWRDKLSPEMLSGMRADFDKLLSVGKRARSVLHPNSTTEKEGSSS